MCNKSGKSSGISTSDSIREKIQELKNFRMVPKEKFKELAEAINANFSFNMELRQISSDCDWTNIFVLSVFKDRVKHLKSELPS